MDENRRGPKLKPEDEKHKRIMISLPPEQLKWLNEFKEKVGHSRSKKIQELIREAMN